MPKRAVIGVVVESDKFLAIERSQSVRAPGKVCFPGGEIEPGESETAALIREFNEELGIQVEPGKKLWQSFLPHGTELNWWTVRISPPQTILPNPEEVANVFWLPPGELCANDQLLPSNLDFFSGLEGRRIFNSKRPNLTEPTGQSIGSDEDGTFD